MIFTKIMWSSHIFFGLLVLGTMQENKRFFEHSVIEVTAYLVIYYYYFLKCIYIVQDREKLQMQIHSDLRNVNF